MTSGIILVVDCIFILDCIIIVVNCMLQVVDIYFIYIKVLLKCNTKYDWFLSDHISIEDYCT